MDFEMQNFTSFLVDLNYKFSDFYINDFKGLTNYYYDSHSIDGWCDFWECYPPSMFCWTEGTHPTRPDPSYVYLRDAAMIIPRFTMCS